MSKTSKSVNLRPFAGSRLVNFLDRHISDLKGTKSQAEIAVEAGFSSRNMLSMIKTGDARLPLDRVPALAKALNCDPAILFKLAVEQQDTALAGVLDEIFGTVVTQNEIGWLREIRDASDHTDPFVTTRAKRAVRAIFGK